MGQGKINIRQQKANNKTRQITKQENRQHKVDNTRQTSQGRQHKEADNIRQTTQGRQQDKDKHKHKYKDKHKGREHKADNTKKSNT